MVVSPYSSNGQVKSVAHYVLIDGGYLKTKHHPLIVDGLILFQQIPYWFMDGFGGSAFYYMAHPDFRSFNLLTGKYPVGCFPNRFNEVGMADCDFIVLAEHRYNAIIFQMFDGHFFCVGFNERKSFYFPS